MSFLSEIKDTLFGATDTSSQDAQISANRDAQEFIQKRAEEARRDVLSLFPGIEQNQLTGIQGAFDVFGQTIPQQVGAFQAGNVGAQEALLAGLPQQQNAILGLPTDLSGLQAQQIPVDLGFAQQQVPNFIPANPALSTAGSANLGAVNPALSGITGALAEAIRSQAGLAGQVAPSSFKSVDRDPAQQTFRGRG